MRPTLALLAAMFAGLLSSLACGAGTPPSAAATPRPSPPGAAEAVYLGDGSVVSVVDGATGQVRRSMPEGAPSPDWSRLYSAAGSDADRRRAAGGLRLRRAQRRRPAPVRAPAEARRRLPGKALRPRDAPVGA